jgi:hypothetical protein
MKMMNMRKRESVFLLLLLLACCVQSVMGTTTSDSYFWSESYSAVGLQVNLNKDASYATPTGGWGYGTYQYYDGRNQIGLVGMNRVNAQTTVTITGDFRFTSISDPTKYRDYKLATVVRSMNTDSVFVTPPSVPDSNKFSTTTQQYMLGEGGGTTKTYSMVMAACDGNATAKWIDFVIVLDDDTTTLADHMGNYSDYVTNLTITMSSPDASPAVSTQTMSFTMNGWYNSDSSATPDFGSYFFTCSPTTLATALKIKDYPSTGSATAAIAEVRMNANVKKSSSKYKLFINADTFYGAGSDETFKLVRDGTTFNTTYNTVSYKLILTPKAGTSMWDSDGNSLSSQEFTGLSDTCVYVAYADGLNSSNELIRATNLDATLSAQMTSDVSQLLAGKYTSTVYLYLVTF